MKDQMVYAYRGDNKELKKIGYTFQKLYAANYKTYHKDDIWMFVRSGMVLEIDNTTVIQQIGIIDFIINNIDNPNEFWERDRIDPFTRQQSGTGAAFVATNNGTIFEWKEYFQKECEIGQPLKQAYYDKLDSGEDATAELTTLRLSEFSADPFVITLKFVNQIKGLHRLGICKVERV